MSFYLKADQICDPDNNFAVFPVKPKWSHALNTLSG